MFERRTTQSNTNKISNNKSNTNITSKTKPTININEKPIMNMGNIKSVQSPFLTNINSNNNINSQTITNTNSQTYINSTNITNNTSTKISEKISKLCKISKMSLGICLFYFLYLF